MEETVSNIAEKATGGIIEQGVMGSFVVLFFIIAAILLWVILKDKDYQRKMADALAEMVENQKNFNLQYRESQENHKEVVSIITDVTKTERANTKECYRTVVDKQNDIDRKLMQVLEIVKEK